MIGARYRSNESSIVTDLKEVSDQDGSVAPRRRARRGDRVRRVVLDVALDCFSNNGFGGTSTRMIAELSGVSHSLILYHFESKEKLWIATMEEVVGSYAKNMADIVNSETLHPAKTLSRFIEEFVKLSARMPQIHRILTQQSTQSSERLDWLVENYLGDHFRTVVELIRRGQDEGLVREGDPARIYYFVIGAVGTPFAVGREYEILTRRNIFSAAEIHHLIDFINSVLFVPSSTGGKQSTKAVRAGPPSKKAAALAQGG